LPALSLPSRSPSGLGAEAGGLQPGLNDLHDLAHLFECGFLARRGGDFADGFGDQNTQGSFVKSLGQELSITTISAASLAASSGRFALVNWSMESRRCLIMVARACCSSVG